MSQVSFKSQRKIALCCKILCQTGDETSILRRLRTRYQGCLYKLFEFSQYLSLFNYIFSLKNVRPHMQKKDVSPISCMKTSSMKMSFGCSKNGKVWTPSRFRKFHYQLDVFYILINFESDRISPCDNSLIEFDIDRMRPRESARNGLMSGRWLHFKIFSKYMSLRHI